MMNRNYNFAYLDEVTKRAIRRALLKAVAIPGHQVPFAAREMPVPYGWGTGGLQVTASVIGPHDVLKVIDMGSDESINATNIRRLFEQTTGVRTTTQTAVATMIQTRHRIPETPLRAGQIVVLQVANPEPLSRVVPSEAAAKQLHSLGEYDGVYLAMYEDIAKNGRIGRSRNYPVRVHGRYVMAPSSIPTFDNPKLHRSPALFLFGAGRERRLYAVPPFTDVESLAFEDMPFAPPPPTEACALCGSTGSFVHGIRTGNGAKVYICSDTGHCRAVGSSSAGVL